MDAAPQVSAMSIVRAAIETVRAETEPAYERADAAALRHQRRHGIIVDVVAVTGTLAVVLGAITLTQPAGRDFVRLAEAVSAAAAIVAVALGIWAGSQRRWLLERHKAEQLRLIAFRALVRFVGDGGRDLAAWTAAMRADVAGLQQRSQHELDRWIASEMLAENARFDEHVRSEALLERVVADYARGVVDAQRAYFVRRAGANERWDKRTRGAIPVLFFISVIATIPGALLRLRGDAAHAATFIAVAVIAPALAAGIRLFRSAHEFGRNGVRFRAKALVLTLLADRLANETVPDALFRELQFAQRLFEAEHREWLQLMLDAEWYG